MMLEVLITSTVLIVGIFCLRKLTFGKISMRLRYGLWLLVAVRLLVPLSLGSSPFSAMNLLPVTLREDAHTFAEKSENGSKLPVGGKDNPTFAGAPEETASVGKAEEKSTDGFKETASEIASETAGNTLQGENLSDKNFRERRLSRSQVLLAVWFAGFLAAGGYMLIGKGRFVRYLYRNRRELSVEKMPDALAERISRRGMKVYQVKGLPAPCLSGRHIYIGEGTAGQEQHLVHVLAHEYCHALHGDGLWAFLRCLLAAVYWFDPFVWAAAYAARQDSELACDEAAVKLLGESSRYPYGRTLLALLEGAGSGKKCPGTSFMTEGGEGSVKERILALTEKKRMKRSVLAVVLAAVVFICGCAFTGAEQGGAISAGEAGGQSAEGVSGSADGGAEKQGMESTVQERQVVLEKENAEYARIQDEYEEAVKGEVVKKAELLEEKRQETEQLEEQLEEQIRELEERTQLEAELAAFLEILNYHGVMEGKDDGELSLNREMDYQTYYEYTAGEAENPMENGWYRICENEEAGITLYGLYTEEFGFRGLKTLIGEDVNTYDIEWCPASVNSDRDNILVLEGAEDGLPRRFVWKLPVQYSSKAEIWRLYSGYRYDTGTVDVNMLSEQDCLAWAQKRLRFDVDQEAAKVHVIWDGDVELGSIDISAYTKWTTEYVQLVPDTFGVMLDDRTGDGATAGSEGGLAVQFVAGLKFEGVEGLWFDDLPLLTAPVSRDGSSESGFRLQEPRIDEQRVARALWQERELEKLQNKVEETDLE